jgi:hypothetical protein
MPQIFVQRRTAGFFEQRFQHHVLAAAFGEALTIFFAERADAGIAVLALDPAALVAVALIEAAFSLGHFFLLQKLSSKSRMSRAHVASPCRDAAPGQRSFYEGMIRRKRGSPQKSMF